MSIDLEQLMADTPLLDGTPPAVIGELAGRGHIRTYRRGTYLFHQGDPSPEMFFLTQGRIEVSSASANGQRQLHATLESPQFFGELGVLGDMPRTASALARDESSVWVVSAEIFLEFLAGQVPASRAILRALSRQVVSHEAFVDDLLYLDLKGRVAKRLLQLVTPSLDELPEDGAVVPSLVTHADIASLCGGSRENITRILSDFRRRGLIGRDGKRFVLKDTKTLAKLAGL